MQKRRQDSLGEDDTVCYLNVINILSLYDWYEFSTRDHMVVLNYDPQILWRFSLQELWSLPIPLTLTELAAALNIRAWWKMYFWHKRLCSFCLVLLRSMLGETLLLFKKLDCSETGTLGKTTTNKKTVLVPLSTSPGKFISNSQSQLTSHGRESSWHPV